MFTTYYLLFIFLTYSFTTFSTYTQFYKKKHANAIYPNNITQDFNVIKENYNSAITSNKSPTLMRTINKQGLVCFHAGLFFPWDNNTAQIKNLTDIDTAWNFVQRLELNRDYYGFLFLNNPTKSTHILDAGCGSGTSSILMSKIFNCYIDGYSLSQEEIKHAQKTAIIHQCSNKLCFFQGNILNLPQKNNTYDAIWISESSEYISSLANLFKEMKRIGKNNTRIVLFAWCAAKKSGKSFMDKEYNTILHTAKEYINSAKQHNFTLIYQQNLSPLVNSYWNIILQSQLYSYEKSFAQASLKGKLHYYLFCFDMKK